MAIWALWSGGLIAKETISVCVWVEAEDGRLRELLVLEFLRLAAPAIGPFSKWPREELHWKEKGFFVGHSEI